MKRGFHVAYCSADASLKPGKEWETWYAFLTGEHGLSAKPAFVGMSRGGEYAYTWATSHPDKVACIYAENPVLKSHMSPAPVLDQLGALARARVPLLHVCGSLDPSLGSQTREAEKRYQALGGRITVLIQEGLGHLPTAPKDPQPVVEFITAASCR